MPDPSATIQAEVQGLFASYLAAKSAHSIDRTMEFFSRTDATYWDVTAGLAIPDRAALKGAFEQYMPHWGPDARSTASKVLGDTTGAALFFTNTPEEFGHEIRGIAVVDIRDGKFVRWNDYWDGRQWDIDALKAFRTPEAKFPHDYGWDKPGEHASNTLTRIVSELAGNLARGSYEDVAKLFAYNSVLEDLTLHTAVTGPRSIAAYLKRAVSSLPYGEDARVRHIVGGDAGGAYEWTNSREPVPRGVTALELDAAGQIVRLTSLWDGSTVDAEWLTRRMAETIEN